MFETLTILKTYLVLLLATPVVLKASWYAILHQSWAIIWKMNFLLLIRMCNRQLPNATLTWSRISTAQAQLAPPIYPLLLEVGVQHHQAFRTACQYRSLPILNNRVGDNWADKNVGGSDEQSDDHYTEAYNGDISTWESLRWLHYSLEMWRNFQET